MSRVLVVSPHLDDETLGCGGTLLRHKKRGDFTAWLNITGASTAYGYSAEQCDEQASQIKQVLQMYNLDRFHNLNLPPAQLDMIPSQRLIEQLGTVIRLMAPSTIYLPFPDDIHTDHRIVFAAAIACTKWFRGSTVRKWLVYETLSETDLALSVSNAGFKPNVYVDISDFIETKLAIMRLYENELGLFPFPRSEEAVRALARIRGVVAGCPAAEGFILLREII